MSKCKYSVLVIIGAAGGVAAVLAHRISRETGKTFIEAAGEVPAEAERYVEEMRARATEAVEAGKVAARQKQSEVEGRIRGDAESQSPGPAA